jgi:hypothetical protein
MNIRSLKNLYNQYMEARKNLTSAIKKYIPDSTMKGRKESVAAFNERGENTSAEYFDFIDALRSLCETIKFDETAPPQLQNFAAKIHPSDSVAFVGSYAPLHSEHETDLIQMIEIILKKRQQAKEYPSKSCPGCKANFTPTATQQIYCKDCGSPASRTKRSKNK